MQDVIDAMSAEMNALRAGAGDAEGLNRGLEAQVAALTEARRAEAAELDRIVRQLAPGEAEGAGHA
jgi:hypothetical protein